MKGVSKDLLRLEKTYFESGPNNQDSKEKTVLRLLEKPKKPDFTQLPRSERTFKKKKNDFLRIFFLKF